jgi:hypothetical protein
MTDCISYLFTIGERKKNNIRISMMFHPDIGLFATHVNNMWLRTNAVVGRMRVEPPIALDSMELYNGLQMVL